MNLLLDKWLPVRDSVGVHRVAPVEIGEVTAHALEAPRADLNAAGHEFLIGLLQTACPPEDEDAWADWLEKPPTRQVLEKHLAPLAPAFELADAEHPFLQEPGLDAASGKPDEIANLLIDNPSGQTLKQNKDFFIKRRSGDAFCSACTSLALIALQSYAPAGGRGNMTALRGGGPLTTLLKGSDLWETIWSNVLSRPVWSSGPVDAPVPEVFPWMTPADDPKGKRAKLHADDVHDAHVYWAMPRRLTVAPGTEDSSCTLCGRDEDTVYTHYHARPYGLDYQGSWVHPLSPSQENEGVISSRKMRRAMGAYRHWVGLVASSGDARYRPATVVHHHRIHRSTLVGGERPVERLHAFGYDMDNAKVRGWYEGHMPVLAASSESVREDVDAHARALVSGTTEAASILRGAYKDALFDRPKDVKADLSDLTDTLWQRTEHAFYASLQRVRSGATRPLEEREKWHGLLKRESRAIFNTRVQYARLGDVDPARIARAELKFHRLLRTKLMKTLDLNRPATVGTEQT